MKNTSHTLLTNSTLCLGLLAIITPACAAPMMSADPKAMDTKDIAVQPTPPTPYDWTIEAGSGVTFSNVRNTSDKGYTIVPAFVTASLKLDEVSDYPNAYLRGNSEFFFRMEGGAIVDGPETRYTEIMVGPRYNFVQPNWKIIPYIEGGVGLLFADSNPGAGGLGQDFNFTFETGAGIKYNINDHWFARLGAEYQHISNAGLSEPQHANNAIDSLGPKLSFGFAF
jgi:opacity protein-like surface antigen